MMKFYTYILLLVGLALFSCGGEEELPEGIWEEDKMVRVLVDMEIAQASVKFKAATENKGNYKKEFDQIFDKHNITKEEFNTNLEFYCQVPLNTKNMYDKVIVQLSEQQAQLNDKLKKDDEEEDE